MAADVKDPREVLALARELLSRADPETAGIWPRAAALLARQALEEAVDQYWSSRQMPLDSLPTQVQLVCMRMMPTTDSSLAPHVHEVWGALSRACHHHPYELAPTAGEVTACIEVVEMFVSRDA